MFDRQSATLPHCENVGVFLGDHLEKGFVFGPEHLPVSSMTCQLDEFVPRSQNARRNESVPTSHSSRECSDKVTSDFLSSLTSDTWSVKSFRPSVGSSRRPPQLQAGSSPTDAPSSYPSTSSKPASPTSGRTFILAVEKSCLLTRFPNIRSAATGSMTM